MSTECSSCRLLCVSDDNNSHICYVTSKSLPRLVANFTRHHKNGARGAPTFLQLHILCLKKGFCSNWNRTCLGTLCYENGSRHLLGRVWLEDLLKTSVTTLYHIECGLEIYCGHIHEGCFIFDFASLLLEVARPIYSTMCTEVAVKTPIIITICTKLAWSPLPEFVPCVSIYLSQYLSKLMFIIIADMPNTLALFIYLFTKTFFQFNCSVITDDELDHRRHTLWHVIQRQWDSRRLDWS